MCKRQSAEDESVEKSTKSDATKGEKYHFFAVIVVEKWNRIDR